MLDRYMEQPRLPPLIPESLPPSSSSSSSSSSSTSHIVNSTSSSCITVLSNPSQPQAPASLSSSAASKSPTLYHLQRMWNTSRHHGSGSSRCWCLFLIILCLQNFTMIASRSISQSSLRPSSPHEEVLQLDLQDRQTLQSPGDAHSVDKRLAIETATSSTSSNESTDVQATRSRFVNNPTLWPNARVPYVFVEPYSYNRKRKVWRAMNYLQDKTCIQFVPKTDEDVFYLNFEVHKTTCSSQIGLKDYLRGEQAVRLTKQCLKNRGIILHELSHALGLYHEHQRPDRDHYINVLWENVLSTFESQFDILDFDTYGVEYDFGSIMHYSLYTFSLGNRFQTMELLSNVTTKVEDIGRQHSLSNGDFLRLNRMYNCQAATTTATTTAMLKSTSSTQTIYNNNLYSGIKFTTSPTDNSRTLRTTTNPPTTRLTTVPPTIRPTTAPPTTRPTTAPPTTRPTTAPPTTRPTTALPTTRPTTATPTTRPTTATPTTRPTTASPTTHPSTIPPTTRSTTAPPTTRPTTAPPTTHPTTAPTTRPSTSLPTTRPTTAPPTTRPTTAPPTTRPTTAPPTTRPTTAPPTTYSVATDFTTQPTATSEVDNYIHSGGRVALKFAEHKIGKMATQSHDPLWLKCTQQHCMLDSCISNNLHNNDSMTTCPYNYFTLRKFPSNSSSDDQRIRVGDEVVLQFLPPPSHPLSGQSLYVSCSTTQGTCAISSDCDMGTEGDLSSYCQSNILTVKTNGKMDGEFVTSMDVIGFEFRLLPQETFFRDQCALQCNHETMQCRKQSCIFIPNNIEGRNQPDPPMRCGKDMFQIQKANL